MDVGGETRGSVVDGQVGAPCGEDLDAAHEQAVGQLVERVPGPVADALVRLGGRLALSDVDDGADGETDDVVDEWQPCFLQNPTVRRHGTIQRLAPPHR